MEKQVGKRLVRTALLVMAATGWPASADDGISGHNPPIIIRVFDYAEIEPRILDGAKRTAARVLRRAGVETAWVDCMGLMNDPSAPLACRQKPGPALLQLSILSREMARKSKLRGSRFGYAQTSKLGFGVIAAVFYHKIEELARMERASEAVILGHVMAHEIGHLLLGTGGHSSRGIMRAGWNAKELGLAAKGILGFTGQQADEISAAAIERAEEETKRSQAGPVSASTLEALQKARNQQGEGR